MTPELPVIILFIPGNLSNPLNGSHRHWSARAKWAKTWREKTVLLSQPQADTFYRHHTMLSSRSPKLILFTAHVWNLMAEDGLRAALKPVVAGLRDANVIHDGGPKSGHRFEYHQIVLRKDRGVEIEVYPLERERK